MIKGERGGRTLTVKLEAERKARHDAEADQKSPVQKAKEIRTTMRDYSYGDWNRYSVSL